MKYQRKYMSLGVGIATISLGILFGGCDTTMPVPPDLSASQVFEPNPGVVPEANGLDILIESLDDKVVCYGSGASINADGTTCDTGNVVADSKITLTSCAVQGATLSYIGVSGAPTTLAGNFDTTGFGACDADNDTISNNTDNCPDIANTNQNDLDTDTIGDACDDNIDGDAFGNAPDDACEYVASDDNSCGVSAADDLDGDGIPDTAIDNCVGVFNPQQNDADGDGLGDKCDAEPVNIVLPLANDNFAQAFVRWKDQVQCDIRCSDPTGQGDMGTINCTNGGTANWDVQLEGLSFAWSYFTYTNCDYTTNEGDRLLVNGTITQKSTLGGDGDEFGTVSVLGGDYTGVMTSHTTFANKTRNGGYWGVSCNSDPLPNEECAANDLVVDVYYPDWSCQDGECDGSTPPVDTDSDLVFDDYDNCVNDANPDQADLDNDGMGTVCDTDGEDAEAAAADDDVDGVSNALDNCPNDANGPDLGPNDQLDTDGDLIGDVCDATPQGDTDGIDYADDNCAFVNNGGQENGGLDASGNLINPVDAEGVDFNISGDICEDQDADGVADQLDVCPFDAADNCLGYQIKNDSDDKCAIESAGLLKMATCDTGDDSHLWNIEADGTVVNVGSGNCVGHTGGDWNVSSCGGSDQAVSFESDGTIKSTTINSCWKGNISGNDVAGTLGNCGLGRVDWSVFDKSDNQVDPNNL